MDSFGCSTAAELASLLGVDGFLKSPFQTIFTQERNVDRDISTTQYGVYLLWEHSNSGQCVLIFTIGYPIGSNGIGIIYDSNNYVGVISKTAEGASFHITTDSLLYSLQKFNIPYQ